jgi:hypothetical protein
MSNTEEIRAPWQPTKLDDAAEALIREVEKDFVPVDTMDSAPAEPSAEVGETAPSQTEPAKAVVAPPAPKEDLSEAVRREMGLKAREEAVGAAEARLAAMEKELNALRSKQVPEDLVEALRYNTAETLANLGLEPDHVVRMVLAHRLGDKAPPELSKEIAEMTEKQRYEARIRALEQENASQKRQAAARAYIEQVQAGAREFLGKDGLSEYAPVVARVAKQNGERVFKEIMEEIERDASIKAMRDPQAPILTYEEAVRRVETRWADFSTVFTPANDPTVPAKKAESTPPKPTNSDTGTVKPPDRPLAPWLQRETELESEGLKAALVEFRRLQNTGA